MKKNLLWIILIVLLLAVSAVSADDLTEVKEAGVLRFGAPLEYIPFVFEDEAGLSGNTETTGQEDAGASGTEEAVVNTIVRR